MRQLIIGTAGHVDHGKTALIKALTGFEGDSTEEEKRRGITIDLSFSHLQNKETNIAFIDVPGHEKLIKNMIAGAFGALIPLLLKRLNIDPAVGSTVILTTATDVFGFLSFLGLASLILVS